MIQHRWRRKIISGTSPMAAAPQSLGLPNNPTTPTDPVFTKSTGSQYAPQTPLSSQPPNLSNSCASGAPFVKNGAQQCLWHIKITPGSPKRNKYKSKFKWGPAMVRNTKPAWRSGMRDNPRGQRHDLYNISAKHTPKSKITSYKNCNLKTKQYLFLSQERHTDQILCRCVDAEKTKNYKDCDFYL